MLQMKHIVSCVEITALQTHRIKGFNIINNFHMKMYNNIYKLHEYIIYINIYTFVIFFKKLFGDEMQAYFD